MNVLIVAQNLFIARLLVSVAEAHQSVSSYKIIVFSSTEKYILNKLHGIYRSNIITISDVAENIQLDTHTKCIENMRGTFSNDTVKRLQSDLLNMIKSQKIFNFEYIWIFNEHTFIGSFLKNSQEYAPKCVVFENSNQNNGVTILGDVFGKSGKDMRKIFLDPQNFPSDVTRFRRPKFYRIITLPFHVRSAQSFNYYFKRILIRAFNVFSFFFIKHKKKFLKHKKGGHPIILIALQIKDDSAIAMNINFSEYCKILVDASIELKTKNPGTIILLRPHPLDYTFGWLSFYNFMRQTAPGVDISLDLAPIEDLFEENLKHLVTFNSNITRHKCFKNNSVKVIHLGKIPSLPPFGETLYQVHENIF